MIFLLNLIRHNEYSTQVILIMANKSHPQKSKVGFVVTAR